MTTAMVCAGAVTAQFVGGKATRDALFLAALDYTALPTMLIATSACSLILVAVNSRGGRHISPARLVPALFAVSGVLLLVEWLLSYQARSAAAVIVYLHISGAGPLLGSGFWLVLSERFDPHTAKKRFGQIAGAGTLGGLLSALLAERIGAVFGVAAMLPVLAAFHFFSAWQIRKLTAQPEAIEAATPSESLRAVAAPAPSGWRVLTEAPYLRQLAVLVLLGTTGSALVDYLFKMEAVKMFGRGDDAPPLLRHLLRGDEPHHVRGADLGEPVRAGTIRTGADHEHAVGCLAGRQHRRSRRAGVCQRDDCAGRRIDLPRFALSRRLRTVLHADPGGGEACREVDRRRGIRPPGRCGGRRPRSMGGDSRARCPVSGDSRPHDRGIGCGDHHRQPSQPRIRSGAREEPSQPGRRARSRGRGRRHDADADAQDAQPDEGRPRPQAHDDGRESR